LRVKEAELVQLSTTLYNSTLNIALVEFHRDTLDRTGTLSN